MMEKTMARQLKGNDAVVSTYFDSTCEPQYKLVHPHPPGTDF